VKRSRRRTRFHDYGLENTKARTRLLRAHEKAIVGVDYRMKSGACFVRTKLSVISREGMPISSDMRFSIRHIRRARGFLFLSFFSFFLLFFSFFFGNDRRASSLLRLSSLGIIASTMTSKSRKYKRVSYCTIVFYYESCHVSNSDFKYYISESFIQ